MNDDAALLSSITHTQRIAQRIGSNRMAVEVYGWVIKHALEIPSPAFHELLDILEEEDQ